MSGYVGRERDRVGIDTVGVNSQEEKIHRLDGNRLFRGGSVASTFISRLVWPSVRLIDLLFQSFPYPRLPVPLEGE